MANEITRREEYSKVEASVLIKRALDLMYEPGDVFEIRIPRKGGGVTSGYFDDTTKAALLIAKENSKTDGHVQQSHGQRYVEPKADGIFVTLNPVMPALLSRAANKFDARAAVTTTDGEILRRRWFPIDLDPVRPSHTSSSEEELKSAFLKGEEIHDWLASIGWPAPIVAMSGNGVHMLYRIDMPNDEDSRQICEFAMKMIGGLFSDDETKIDGGNWNASRIFKVYGTIACKGSDTPERPHRVSYLKSIPDPIETVPTEKMALMAKGLRDSNDDDFKLLSGEYIPDMEQWLLDRGYRVTSPARPFGDGGKKWTIGECPFNPAHKKAMVAINGRNRPVFKCLHDSCSAYTWKEFRYKIDPDFADPVEVKKRLIDWGLGDTVPSPELLDNVFALARQRNKVITEVKKLIPKPRFLVLVDAITEEARERRKHGRGEFNDKGNVVGLIQRTRVYQSVGDLPSYWTSTFDQRVRVGSIGDINAERYSDIHDIKLMIKFHEQNDVWVRSTHAAQIIKELASENKINPMRAHLKSFEWDHVPRLDTWLPKYMGTIDNAYSRAIGRKWLISAAARGMDPGCQADHMLILEGEQGIGKSQCLRVLGGEYYIEYSRAISGNNTGHKDMVASILGKLIVEMSELATMRRGDMETLKAILTTTTDDARLSYERDAKQYPRTCVFAGTTNELEGNYIQDQSGARRFWPIKVGVTHRPDIASLKAVRDLLWAEAVYAYEAGEDWFVVPAETVRLEQEERQMRPEDIDPWYGQVLQGLKQADTYENHLFQARSIYVNGQIVDGMLIFAGEFHAILGILLKVEGARQQASDVFRVRAILRQIGFKKVRSRRAVSDSNYQYQLRKEDIHPETWEMIVKAVEKSGIAIES